MRAVAVVAPEHLELLAPEAPVAEALVRRRELAHLERQTLVAVAVGVKPAGAPVALVSLSSNIPTL